MMGPQNDQKTPDWQTLRELYEQRAEEYRFVSQHEPWATSRKHTGMIAHLAFAPGSRVLDAGCGDGVYCAWLSRQSHTAIVGVDISTKILAIARSNIAGRGNADVTYFAAGNLEQMPFADASFDGVLCSQVIEHLLDDLAGLEELYRVLRSGGRLVISTDNHDNWVTRCLAAPILWVRALLRRESTRYPFPHGNYRLKEFVARVAQVGFCVESAQTYRFSLPHSLSQVPGLTRLLDWIEVRLIHMPGVRQWGDMIVVEAHKP